MHAEVTSRLLAPLNVLQLSTFYDQCSESEETIKLTDWMNIIWRRCIYYYTLPVFITCNCYYYN